MQDNREKYENKTIDIFVGNKKIDTMLVRQVIRNDFLYGTSKASGIDTAYHLSDSIRIVVCENI